MIFGRAAEISRELFRFRRLAVPATLALAALILLGVSATVRNLALDRHQAVRREYRGSAERARTLRALSTREGEVRRALETLRGGTGRKEALREVFEPFVAPGNGVETKNVSYKVTSAGNAVEAYEIRFLAEGSYPDLARFLVRIESGKPLAAVESLFLGRPKDGKDLQAEVAVRVPVR